MIFTIRKSIYIVSVDSSLKGATIMLLLQFRQSQISASIGWNYSKNNMQNTFKKHQSSSLSAKLIRGHYNAIVFNID